MSKVTSMELRGTGCVSGMSAGVCFAPRTPATFAVVRTSPFGSARSMSFFRVAFDMRAVAAATASRRVVFFTPTSTIEMPPVSSRCEKSGSLIDLQICGSVHVDDTLAGVGDELHFDLVEEPADVVSTRRDAALNCGKYATRVAGAENLRLA